MARAVGAKLCWKQSGRAFFADFDLMTKSWVARRRDAIRESFEIPPPPHAGLPLSLPEYNLESWRPAWSWWQMAAYNCNHPEGGWGSVWR
ncbi:hypothetical protein J2S96_001038 [Arthrobacter bambusae]|nr:hypothetical protein [Arthrobacter bambusae]